MSLGRRVREYGGGRRELIDEELTCKARVDRATGICEHEERKPDVPRTVSSA